jgi:DNA (cytosine-5)-methyltransferase 1
MQQTLWFTKAKRAQSNEDYETWIQGGVMPTLNAMDNNGEAFATVLILMEQGEPVIMRNREGCAGGGKGPMYSDKSFTLATSNDQILILAVDGFNQTVSNVNQTLRVGSDLDKMGMVLIIDGTRVDDVRVYEDGIVPTVISRYGTGGGNVPMVFPIDDARELEKHQNGTGIGDEGAPAYTLDRQQAPGVVAVDFYNASLGDTSQTIRAHTATAVNIGGVIERQVVRRLTPMECERLQGFPDGWTDGQADSNRYKQMGNAVAVPVVQWIVNRMVAE